MRQRGQPPMPDPLDPAAPVSRGAVLASYRIDTTTRVWPLMVPAGFLVTFGALGICTAFISRGPLAEHAEGFTLVGGASMVCGLLIAISGVRPILTHDEYLLAMERGLVYRHQKTERFLAWGETTSVVWDEQKAAVIVSHPEGDLEI
ncbi:MAG TPA: hypothetical protein VGI39_08460, partial [Polyangiaceae bacterium]